MKLYLPFPRSSITQPFNGNANPLYAGQGLKGHTAIDWNASCGTKLYNCIKGYCYSVMHKDDPDLSKYRAVFFLVEDDTGVYEVSYGHLQDIYAIPGNTYDVGAMIATTGNTGPVYSGGVAVTKYRPGCPGGHLHGPQVRPVKKVKSLSRSKQYLNDGFGPLYKDEFYYEITNYGNGWNGCVDPEQFLVETLAKDAVVTQPPNTSVSYEEALANLQKANLPKLVRLAAEAILRLKYWR